VLQRYVTHSRLHFSDVTYPAVCSCCLRVALVHSALQKTVLKICFCSQLLLQVVNLSELKTEQLERVYSKFAKELYILSKLRAPQIVNIYGACTTVTELTLVMEVQ
jgi:Protein tyrosine and serine/threonine kinase